MSNHHQTNRSLLRTVTGHIGRVTPMELFFDLVYVFAITQLSRHLAEHLDLRGAFETTLLLLAVWWAWNYTTWFTNWFDPDLPAVRIVLLVVMLISLVMSATLPEAFGEHGLIFAGAYVGVQVGRNIFAVIAAPDARVLQRNLGRVLAWSVAAGLFWISGGLVDHGWRDFFWLAAVGIDYAGPWQGFWTPGLGRSTTTDWAIEGSHMAERCQLFVMIALGESVLETGAALSGLTLSVSVLTAFLIAFFLNVALWWLYFARSAEAASAVIARSTDTGRLGRTAYTYFHLPMIAGIIVTAVAIERLISEPMDHASIATVATVIGGPVLFLAGHFLFKWAFGGHFAWSRISGIAGLLVLAPLAPHLSLLAASGIAAAIVGIVAAWDTMSRHRAVTIEVERPVQLEES